MKKTQKEKITLPLQAILLAVFCNALFGSVSPILKISYEEFSIGTNAFLQIFFAGVRFFISGILVFIIATIKNKKVVIPRKENTSNILFVALTYTFLQYVFFYVGISRVKGSIGSVINSLSAFIAIIVAHFIYPNDKLNWQKGIGTCLGFIGVLLALLSGSGDVAFSLWGEVFIIIATICFVIGSIFNKQATRLNDSYVVTAYNLLLGGLGLIVVGFIGGFDQIQTFTLTWKGVLAFLYLVAVSSVGFTIWSVLLKKYNLGSLGIFNFVIPVSGAIFSALLLGENILKIEYCLALSFVVLGIIIINLKTNKRK